jgi:hypothetical protein
MLLEILFITISLILIIKFIKYLKIDLLTNVNSNSSVSEKKRLLINGIKEFINPDTSYGDFIDELKRLRNTSFEIIKSESFYELKFISKTRNITDDDILVYLNDME